MHEAFLKAAIQMIAATGAGGGDFRISVPEIVVPPASATMHVIRPGACIDRSMEWEAPPAGASMPVLGLESGAGEAIAAARRKCALGPQIAGALLFYRKE